jgi:hypothetical protein
MELENVPKVTLQEMAPLGFKARSLVCRAGSLREDGSKCLLCFMGQPPAKVPDMAGLHDKWPTLKTQETFKIL